MPKNITVRCPTCQERVNALVLVPENELEALDSDADVRVMHTATGENVSRKDHVWNLSRDERKNLRKASAEGVV